MRPLKEGTPHELYLRVSSAAKPMAPLKLYANVIGKFTVERELQEKIQAQLRDRTREEEKLRRGHKTQWLETPPDLHTTNGKKRKAPQASMFRKPPTDFLRPGNASTPSSARPLSPAPLPSSSTKESFAPTRKRLIQCLAVSERTTDEAVKLVGGGDPDSSWRRDFMNLLGDVSSFLHPTFCLDVSNIPVGRGTNGSSKEGRRHVHSPLASQSPDMARGSALRMASVK
jgi:RNA polymerase II elongation factor ELL